MKRTNQQRERAFYRALYDLVVAAQHNMNVNAETVLSMACELATLINYTDSIVEAVDQVRNDFELN